MDESFAFIGTPDPRRLNPWGVRLGVAGTVVVLLASLFVTWAIASERTSLTRLDAANAASGRQVVAQNRQVAVAEAAATGQATAAPSAAAQQAQAEAFAALRAAKALHRRTGTFAAASPAALSSTEPGAVFVDGPSPDPQIVSVAADESAWAAAVMALDGTCYYVKIAAQDPVRYGSGSACTGADAMGATGSGW